MSEMIKRVAGAIEKAAMAAAVTDEYCSPEMALAAARAAIEAMRVPTQAMWDAYEREGWYFDEDAWGRMIDAALPAEAKKER